jgi:peptidase S24-like protein
MDTLVSDDVRKAIKDAGLTMAEGAERLGMSHQNLNKHLRADKLSNHFIRLFKEKFKAETKVSEYKQPKSKPVVIEEGTPIYDISATAGGLANTSQLPEVPAFSVKIPGYEDCNFGMYVYGHSMYPTVENGSLILCRKVKDKSVIMYGEIYLLRTEDYLMVKRLQKSTKEENVLATSDNFEQRAPQFKRYEPFDVAIDNIIDLYLVKGIIKKTQS